MAIARRYQTGRKVFRNEIDRLVVESGLTNNQVAEQCGFTVNRVVGLRRSNTFKPEMIEVVRKNILPHSTPSQECSMLSKLSISELADELIEEIIGRLLPHYKKEKNDTPRNSNQIQNHL